MIEVREDHGHPLAVVSGEIDEAASAALTYYVDCVLDFDIADVVVDLGGVTFIDSHGLKALLGELERTSAQGHGNPTNVAARQLRHWQRNAHDFGARPGISLDAIAAELDPLPTPNVITTL